MSHQDLAQLVLAVALLPVHRLPELLRRDPAAPHQDVAQPVAPVHDRGVDDLALVEIDRAEVLPVGEREAAGPPPQEQELDDVGEAGLLEASLDRHQRHSSSSAVAELGPLPDHLLPAARAAGGRRHDAARSADPGPRAAGAAAGRSRRRAPRAPGRPSGARCRASAALSTRWSCATQHPDGIAGRAARYSTSSGVGRRRTSRSSSRVTTAKRASPDRAPGESTTSPPSSRVRSRGSSPVSSASGTGGGEHHLPSRLEQQVEEHEQLVLGAVLVGDEVHVVEQERRRPGGSATRQMPTASRSIASISSPVNSGALRQATGAPTGLRQALPMACSRWVFPAPAPPTMTSGL